MYVARAYNVRGVGAGPVGIEKGVVIDLAILFGSERKATIFVAGGAADELVAMSDLA